MAFLYHKSVRIVCLMGLLTGLSVAIDAADTLRVETMRLDEVEVVARQSRTILPPQRLAGDQLQALSTQSVADAVRYFSGVQIKDYGGVGGMKTVDVRSMGSQHLGVFYDGIEVGNAQNGTVDLGKFSMDNLESVELYNGQKSDIFQPAKDFGSAGTLYLTTRRPRFTEGKDYNVEVRMRAGSFGIANPSLLYEQKLGRNIHLTSNIEYTWAHGRYPFRYRRNYPDGTTAWDTTSVRQNGDVQALRAEAGLYGYTDDSKWHVRGYYYQSERGIPGAIVNNVWQNSQRQWDRNAFVQGNYTVSFPIPGRGYAGRCIDLQVNAKYANDKLRYLNPDTTLQYIDQTYLQQEVYTDIAARMRIFPWWDVSLAADYTLGWLRSDKALFANPMRHTLQVSLATAMSYRWIKVQASLLETYVRDRLYGDAASWQNTQMHYQSLAPAIYINVKPILTEEWYLRSFYKSVQRMPTFNELYYQESSFAADLRPERARQVDLGTEWSRTWTQSLVGWSIGLKADGYYNEVRDKIIAVPKGNSQYRWATMNIGRVDIWGAEAGLDVALRSARTADSHRYWGEILLHAGYTFQRAIDHSEPEDNDPYYGTYGGQIAYIPRHSCSATATYIWRGLSVNYAFVYVGERYSSSANIRENYIQPWYTHDMSASYRWDLSDYTPRHTPLAIQLGAELNNIFNQQYEVIPNYPMPGINGKAIVKIIL